MAASSGSEAAEPLLRAYARGVVVAGVEKRLGKLTAAIVRTLWEADGEAVSLSRLQSLAYANTGKTIPTDADRVTRVLIHRLRASLLGSPYRIETVYRKGYRLCGPRRQARLAIETTEPDPSDHFEGEAGYLALAAEEPPERGCRYPTASDGTCGARQRLGSSYCPSHHAICYLTPDRSEKKLQEFERLAGHGARRNLGTRPGSSSRR